MPSNSASESADSWEEAISITSLPTQQKNRHLYRIDLCYSAWEKCALETEYLRGALRTGPLTVFDPFFSEEASTFLPDVRGVKHTCSQKVAKILGKIYLRDESVQLQKFRGREAFLEVLDNAIDSQIGYMRECEEKDGVVYVLIQAEEEGLSIMTRNDDSGKIEKFGDKLLMGGRKMGEKILFSALPLGVRHTRSHKNGQVTTRIWLPQEFV